MTSRILIVDTVPTNRIVLKVKMLAAKFKVDSCGTQQEAEHFIASTPPDLMLVNLSDPTEDLHAFCQSLRDDPATASIAIISVGVADTTRARFAALDAGADDVLPRPINDALLLARIRSLLRVRNAHQELRLRDGTSRALGFEEARSGFKAAAKVTVLSADLGRAAGLRDRLQIGIDAPLGLLLIDDALVDDLVPVPDLFVIDATQSDDVQNGLLHLVSDLRCRRESRLSTIMVILPKDQPEAAAMALDLGADDAISWDICDQELVLRANALIRQKHLHDRLRNNLQDGLQAAVTDSLTGLYNRRYFDSHLSRMADHAKQERQEFAVMMIDVDHFKAINDTFGHSAGDTVLVEISRRLRENLRAIDLVARVGGEEFMIAMPNTTPEMAYLAAERLREIIGGTPFDIGGDRPAHHVTISLGVSIGGVQFGAGSLTSDICSRADAALYAAKHAGRDTVSMSSAA